MHVARLKRCYAQLHSPHSRPAADMATRSWSRRRISTDLSITRIAGLTWNEWNARLAMPLVTQLREGVNPLIFPTDLSINAMDKQCSSAASVSGASSTAADRKSPSIITPPNELSATAIGASAGATSKSSLNCSAAATAASGHAEKSGGGGGGSSAAGGGVTVGSASKMKHLSEEEATALMLKAAAEKSAANNLSGNLSDNSFGEDGANTTGGGGGSANTSGDYHSALSGAAAFADVGGTAGLCNISILSNISALNSLIGGAGGNGLGGSAGTGPGVGSGGAGGAGSGGGGGGGHPCPECGRVYKLKSSLRNHQKWECGKEPQFQCPFCVYRAKQKMHIGRHMERMHKEKFIKLEDLKSYTSGSGDESSSATAAAALAASAELRQHFT